MGILVNKSLVHWNYFVALEQDLAKISRFIEFSEQNFNTYSIELAHLLLASSSEIDVVLKALCSLETDGRRHANINDYKITALEKFPDIVSEPIFVPRFGLQLTPWDNWSKDESPFWWRAYNNVKHERDQHFSDANLKNTINSLGALSLVVLYYYKSLFALENPDENEFKDVTRRFSPKPELIEYTEEYSYQHLIV